MIACLFFLPAMADERDSAFLKRQEYYKVKEYQYLYVLF